MIAKITPEQLELASDITKHAMSKLNRWAIDTIDLLERVGISDLTARHIVLNILVDETAVAATALESEQPVLEAMAKEMDRVTATVEKVKREARG